MSTSPAREVGPLPGAEPDMATMFVWLVRLRWLAVGGIAAVLLLSGPVLGLLPRESVRPLWAVLAGLAAYNAALQYAGRAFRPGGPEGPPYVPRLTHFASQIVIDCAALTLFVHFAGGVENPFLPLFVLHVVNANIVLRPRAASQILLLAIALAAAVVLGEGSGLLAHYGLHRDPGRCWGATVSLPSLAALGGLVLALIASAFFARHLTARLQDSERRLTAALEDRLALERHLMREERMAVVGKMAAAVAHEINNPIGVVSLYAQHALGRLPAGHPIEGHLEVIRRNAESCRTVLGDLLGLARTRQPERKAVDLRGLCRDVARSVEPMAARSGVRLVNEDAGQGGAPLLVDGDADQLYQAALNLAVNAIEACSSGDSVALRAGEETVDGTTSRLIEVRDSGYGIPADQRERIFQPFYSTKSTGTGLGLAVADIIVKRHAGRITVLDEHPRGTVFRIHLPANGHEGASSGPGARRPEPTTVVPAIDRRPESGSSSGSLDLVRLSLADDGDPRTTVFQGRR